VSVKPRTAARPAAPAEDRLDAVEVVDETPVMDDVEVVDDGPASPAAAGGGDPFAGLDVPEAMRQDVRAELTRGEEVVWVGRPSMTILLAQATTLRVVGVVLLAAGVGMLAGIAFAPGGAVTIGLSVFGGVFLLFGVLFVLARTFIKRGESQRSVYVLTSRRALVLEGKVFGAGRVRAYTIAQLKGMQRVDSWRFKGAGDLVFEKEDVSRGNDLPSLPGTLRSRGPRATGPQYRNHGFLMLENVKAVEKLVRETLIDRGLDKVLAPEQ
jgi:hypothetical protein